MSTIVPFFDRGVFTGQGMPYAELMAAVAFLTLAYTIAFFCPNTWQIFGLEEGPRRWTTEQRWRPLVMRSAMVGVLLWMAGFGVVGSAPTVFLYFQF